MHELLEVILPIMRLKSGFIKIFFAKYSIHTQEKVLVVDILRQCQLV